MKSEIYDQAQAVLRPQFSVMSGDVWHSKLVTDDEKFPEEKKASRLKESHTYAKSDLMFANEKKAMKELLEIVHSAKGAPKTLSVPKYIIKPEPYGSNYVGVISASKNLFVPGCSSTIKLMNHLLH